MKKNLTLKMIVLFAAILLVFVGAKSAKAETPYNGVTYYVNVHATGEDDGTSWQDAFTDLQDALDAAASGDEIWVAEGTYTPDASDRSATFSLKSGVKIYGGFEGDEKALRERSLDPSLTVLSGDIGTSGDDTDNSYHVVYANGVTDVVLDGFTVTGGRADGGPAWPESYDEGGGMYNIHSALTVSNCIFTENWARVAGGGMNNMYSALTVSDCIFSRNEVGSLADCDDSKGGGGMCNKVDSLSLESQTIVNCIFTENRAWMNHNDNYGGGGMLNVGWTQGSSPVVESCTFERNWSYIRGGGMHNYQAEPTVTNCVFNANEAGMRNGGGMSNYTSTPEVTNCIFNANWAYERGGGIYHEGSGGTIKNSTFYRNGRRTYTPPGPWKLTVTALGGAIYIYDGRNCTITNVIFDSNAACEATGAVKDQTSDSVYERTTLESCLFHGNVKRIWTGSEWNEVPDDIYAPNALQINLLFDSEIFDSDPLFVNASDGDFHLRYDSPCIDAGSGFRHGNVLGDPPMPATDFEGDKRIIDGDGDGVLAVDIGVDEYIPNLPDLGAFLEDLADSGELDEATAARLLAYVDDAQMALDEDEEETAITILNELIADVGASLGDTETAQLIEMKTEAVIEEI